ncbi:MAG: hypothetical protein RMJ07_04740 [Nitrososphaerota archaeon]|nr:hypothetical protein [Candidatus Bathyarchaeota archaeon]MDW8048972.1 hypothetical protein [Nitrososphaerota archaeon]
MGSDNGRGEQKGRRKRIQNESRGETVKVIYKPAKEIVILDCFQFSNDRLSQMFAKIIHSGLPVMAQWAEGVLFIYFPLAPDTNDLMDNYLRGRVFWSSVNFTLMPKYSSSIKVSGLEIPVIDVSDHPVLREVARWLNEYAKSKEGEKSL